MKSTTSFYSDLPVNDSSISKLIGDKTKFSNLPADWHILVADIRNSTAAVQNGNHNHVNLVATGCVIAILNLAEAHGIAVPFFFGGDGASFLIPEKIREQSLSVLEKHNRNTKKNFGFSLAIGSANVADIYNENIELKIARVNVNKTLNIPVILGNGLHFAENKIKTENSPKEITPDDTRLNLTGMECKWDRIKPPKKDQEVISLIIAGCGETDFSKVYSEIMGSIDKIFGSIRRRKPVSVRRLKIKAGLQRIKDEMKIKLGKWSFTQFVKSIMVANFGEFYLRNTTSGKNYLQKLVELSDNLTLDGRINTVITGTSDQRKRIIAYLDKLENLNLIKYGYHVSEESIMSCYVKDMSTDQHIHFIDGGNGGYTKAANQLKLKFQD
ncbi:DUF3095 family protein [Christiangramia forsetii]|uniref:DUF3095 domain-containing protein n=2 Tax=Christiangramia forsetii TaxID=411153 RepID=A0M6Z4_CHRFK|nr:DUF3095 family protein [Christiangramia forsetii]GGG29109.1 hypothetical protein GCM10011532_10740 [Christiangramia forsetii]CAL68389.1 conserved hypothetical protein [Christiangramia forsetii KT0803]